MPAKDSDSFAEFFDPKKNKDTYKLKRHPHTGRYIDACPKRPRTRPMRILCLGMARTGTLSTYTALNKLGYHTYHMSEVMKRPRTNLSLWSEAYEAKYDGKGKAWGREEFDKMLGDYDALLDVPCIAFVEELVAAYPDAKVLLTNRDVDAWLQSINSTFGVAFSWPSWNWVADWDQSLAGPFVSFSKLYMPKMFGYEREHFGTKIDYTSAQSPARQAYFDHYALVRKTVPKDRLLEFRVQDGWAPLCAFTGDAVPEGDFPRVNDSRMFVNMMKLIWWLAVGKMVTKVSLALAVPAGGVLATLWWRGYRFRY